VLVIKFFPKYPENLIPLTGV